MTTSGTPRNTRRLRVAVVTTDLWSGANTLWQAAAAHGADVLLIGSERTRRDEDEVPGVHTVALPELDLGRGLIYRHLRGLRSTLKAFRPDVVHVNGELWSVTVQEVLDLGLPVVPHGAENLWSHGGALEQRFRHRLVARALRRSAGYASWNHGGIEHVRGLVAPSFPLFVMPAIVPPSLFSQTVWSPPSSARGRLDILLVGRLVPLKDFTTVVRAAALLPEGSTRIRICGEGPEDGQLRVTAQRVGVEIEMLGRQSPETLARLMADSSLLVQPSVSTPDNVEQFGRAVAEGMTVGVPCVVSDSGELPFLVGHDGDAIFHEGDHVGLAERLATLSNRNGALAELSHRQHRLAAAYEPAEAGRRLLEFWEQAARGLTCG